MAFLPCHAILLGLLESKKSFVPEEYPSVKRWMGKMMAIGKIVEEAQPFYGRH
jgi:hypothetical protein